MASPDCNACEDLREHAPDFVNNGVTKKICTSLKNDTGLNPSATTIHTDCEDLDTANDCMIGRMEQEINQYDVCDWKEFMKKFIHNLWQLLKAIICAICGLWTNIHKLDCEINYMIAGHTFAFGEETDGDAYCVAGKGVSFLNSSGGDTHTADVKLQYIAGGLMRGVGSYRFYNEDFTDPKKVGNFDNGSTYRESTSRKGNSVWGTPGRPANGGELICELRYKESAFPEIKGLFAGFGQETGGGAYHVQTVQFSEGEYAFGQHGWCDEATGEPSSSGYDSGHKVPEGWRYIQLRLTYCFEMGANGNQYSPIYFMGVRTNRDKIDC